MAPMLAQPIDKGLPAPGLLAEVLVNKYYDALPLYRQSQRFNRSTLKIKVRQVASEYTPVKARCRMVTVIQRAWCISSHYIANRAHRLLF